MYPQLGYKSLFFCAPVHVFFYTSRYPSSSESLNTIQQCAHLFLCILNLVTKVFFSAHLFMFSFTPQSIHHHLNHSTCYITGFCTSVFTLFNIYLGMVVFTLYVYRVNRLLTLLLHSNTCRTEYLYHENLS